MGKEELGHVAHLLFFRQPFEHKSRERDADESVGDANDLSRISSVIKWIKQK